MQIKTTMRYRLRPIRMAIFKKFTNNKCWRGCGEKETLLYCLWKCKLVQPLCSTVWLFLKKLKAEYFFLSLVPPGKCVYIYIYRERERGREKETSIYLYIPEYICIYSYIYISILFILIYIFFQVTLFLY